MRDRDAIKIYIYDMICIIYIVHRKFTCYDMYLYSWYICLLHSIRRYNMLYIIYNFSLATFFYFWEEVKLYFAFCYCFCLFTQGYYNQLKSELPTGKTYRKWLDVVFQQVLLQKKLRCLVPS